MSTIFQNIKFAATTFLLTLCLAGYAAADIYAFVDENGVSHFSNVPNDKNYTLYLRTPQTSQTPAVKSTVNQGKTFSLNQKRFTAFVEEAAKIYQVETALLHAVITAESNYNPNALSPKGAIGLMQLMPGTAKRYGIANPYDPAQNIRGGAQYLKYLLSMFNNDLQLVLAAYNAGENAVAVHGNRLPPYKETMLYVPKVLGYYQKYRVKI